MSFHHIYLIDWMHSHMIVKKKQLRFSRQSIHIYCNCFDSRHVCVFVDTYRFIYCEHRLHTQIAHNDMRPLMKTRKLFSIAKINFFLSNFSCKSILLWQTCTLQTDLYYIEVSGKSTISTTFKGSANPALNITQMHC